MKWLMLQQEQPEDFVIATGVQHSVRDFVDAAAKERSLPNSWRGERVDEVVQCFHHRLSGKVDRHARDDGGDVVL